MNGDDTNGPLPSFATVDDLADRWHAFTDEGQTTAEILSGMRRTR